MGGGRVPVGGIDRVGGRIDERAHEGCALTGAALGQPKREEAVCGGAHAMAQERYSLEPLCPAANIVVVVISRHGEERYSKGKVVDRALRRQKGRIGTPEV